MTLCNTDMLHWRQPLLLAHARVAGAGKRGLVMAAAARGRGARGRNGEEKENRAERDSAAK